MERTTKFYRELFGSIKIKCKGMDDTVLEDNRQYFIATTKDDNCIDAPSGIMQNRQGT
jgi:predicted enzyme related to lactoylglutathione lyase